MGTGALRAEASCLFLIDQGKFFILLHLYEEVMNKKKDSKIRMIDEKKLSEGDKRGQCCKTVEGSVLEGRRGSATREEGRRNKK